MSDERARETIDVDMREYIRLLIAQETGVIVAELKAMDKAHGIQAVELARRLDELNHQHARSSEERGHFITRELYDAKHAELQQLVAGMQTEMSEGRGRSAVIAAAAAIVASLIVGLMVVAAQHLMGVKP